MRGIKRLANAKIFLVILNVFCFSNIEAGELIINWYPNTENDLLGYKVYYGTSSGNYTTVRDAGNVNSYTVSGLSEGVEYFFVVTAYDTAYNESSFSIEVRGIIEVTDTIPPQISSVNPVSSIQIDLTFSEQVEKSSAENLSNYQISNGIVINSIELDSNQQVAHINTTSHQPGTYIITINNVYDLATHPNMIAPNSYISYQIAPEDTIPPTITDVQILDATHVDITFSETINKSAAENIQNYKIINAISILQANLDQNNRTVHLLTSSHISGTTYTLTINNICDRSLQPNYIAPNSSVQYYYYEEDVTPPSIYSAYIRNENLVDVVFSEKVEQTSAENIQNFEIDNGVNVLVAILDMNQKIVHLSTTAHQPNIVYTLTISNVADLAPSPNIIAPNTIYNYTYQPDDHTPPEILEAEVIDSTHLRITFSESIDRESAELENNYSIDKGVSIIEALLDSNKMSVHLTTTAHQSGENYTLTVNHIKDHAPIPNEIVADYKIQYNYIYQDREPPKVANVQLIYTTYLKVIFNEPVDRESAENVLNYSINGGIQVIDAVLDSDTKTIYLTTSEHQPNATYSLTIKGVRDQSPNSNEIIDEITVKYFFEVTAGSLVQGLDRTQYELAYLNVGDEYYIDRNYTVTNIPTEINGHLWIKTANDDRNRSDDNFLNFKLNKVAKIYIAYDSRASSYPNWLVNDFYRIGKSIGVSENTGNLDLWEKVCEPGEISLGANLAEGAGNVKSMYVVIVETKGSRPPGLPDDMGDPLSLGPAKVFLLYQNYPNPFNAGTEIRFQLPKHAYVELTVYDILGKTVRNLTRGYKPPGHHILKWNGINDEGLAVPSGVYFSRLIIKKVEDNDNQINDLTVYNHVRKMIMLK